MSDYSSNIPFPFQQRKRNIVDQISSHDYTDRSPKGSIDTGIRHLIDDINAHEGLVTTSSCAGRVSIFLEGRKSLKAKYTPDQAVPGYRSEDDQKYTMMPETDKEFSRRLASAGGKGGDGRWLWVSHSPVPEPDLEDDMYYSKLFGLSSRDTSQTDIKQGGARYVHFKFEPMILHVWTASLAHAQLVLTAALHAGFRESGAVNVARGDGGPSMPMAGIRCQGLALEAIIGMLPDTNEAVDDSPEVLVTEEYLRTLVAISNERFAENSSRTEKFRKRLLDLCQADACGTSQLDEVSQPKARKVAFEDAKTRQERKKAEGMTRRHALQQKHEKQSAPSQEDEELDLSSLIFMS